MREQQVHYCFQVEALFASARRMIGAGGEQTELILGSFSGKI
jgi:hypothetical protein